MTWKSRATLVGRQRPATTYQARPRHVPSDSRLRPVLGSAQPPPWASGLFLPSPRFTGSAGAPLGPGFFLLFTSDMSGRSEDRNGGAAVHPRERDVAGFHFLGSLAP